MVGFGAWSRSFADAHLTPVRADIDAADNPGSKSLESATASSASSPTARCAGNSRARSLRLPVQLARKMFGGREGAAHEGERQMWALQRRKLRRSCRAKCSA